MWGAIPLPNTKSISESVFGCLNRHMVGLSSAKKVRLIVRCIPVQDNSLVNC